MIKLIGPVIIRRKLIAHNIYKLNVWWDEDLDATTCQKYINFRNQLQLLKEFQVNRLFCQIIAIQLHSSADASAVGNDAATYIRTIDSNNETTVECCLK